MGPEPITNLDDLLLIRDVLIDGEPEEPDPAEMARIDARMNIVKDQHASDETNGKV